MKNDENNIAPNPGLLCSLHRVMVFPSILTLRPCVGRWRWHPSGWRCRCCEHKSNIQLFDTWTTLATCYKCYHMTYLMMSYAPYCKAIKYFVRDTTVKELNGCMSCHFGTSIDTPSWVACFSQQWMMRMQLMRGS